MALAHGTALSNPKGKLALEYAITAQLALTSIYPPTIVYSGWTENGMPRKFFSDAKGASQLFVDQTREFLERTGVRLICSGHQPQGDMPNTIRVELSDSTPAFVLCCDNSYSGDTMWHNLPSDSKKRENLGRGKSRSGRGMHAVSEVLIEQCLETGKLLEVYSHGILSDGTFYETKPLELDETQERVERSYPSLIVGKMALGPLVPAIESYPHEGKWWTRAEFIDGSYLLATGHGFSTWNRIVKP